MNWIPVFQPAFQVILPSSFPPGDNFNKTYFFCLWPYIKISSSVCTCKTFRASLIFVYKEPTQRYLTITAFSKILPSTNTLPYLWCCRWQRKKFYKIDTCFLACVPNHPAFDLPSWWECYKTFFFVTDVAAKKLERLCLSSLFRKQCCCWWVR